MLRRALFGHHVQHHHASQNALLHGQPHHPLYGHLLSDYIDILPAVRFRREGKENNKPIKLTSSIFVCFFFFRGPPPPFIFYDEFVIAFFPDKEVVVFVVKQLLGKGERVALFHFVYSFKNGETFHFFM